MVRLREVYCGNGLCSFRLRKGKPLLIARLAGRAELRCPSCKVVAVYGENA